MSEELLGFGPANTGDDMFNEKEIANLEIQLDKQITINSGLADELEKTEKAFEYSFGYAYELKQENKQLKAQLQAIHEQPGS